MKRAFAADFLTRSNDKNGPAGFFKLRGHVPDSGDESCYAAFHVGRAAAVHLAVDNLPGKWIDTPGRVSQRNGIDMAGEAQRRLARGPSYPGDQVGPIRSKMLQRRLHSDAGEDSL